MENTLNSSPVNQQTDRQKIPARQPESSFYNVLTQLTLTRLRQRTAPARRPL